MSINLRSFSDFILRHRWRAIAVSFFITFVPLIGTISIVITGLITLRKGILEGFWILLAATLPYFVLLPFQPHPIGFWVVGIITTSNILTWGFAALLYRTANWSVVLEVAALLGIIIVLIAHVVKPDLGNFWEKQLGNYLSQVLAHNETKPTLPGIAQHIHSSTPALLGQHVEHKMLNNNASPPTRTPAEASPENIEPELISFVNAAKLYATGALAASLLLTAILQLFIARWWQALLTSPEKFRLEVHHIRLSYIAGLAFLIVIILSYTKIELALDLLPVLYLTFCLAGLSMVHYVCSKFTLGWLWLFVFYSILICSWMIYHLPLIFQLIALMALIDVWFDWRGRIDKRF